jgi:hypothetical protein
MANIRGINISTNGSYLITKGLSGIIDFELSLLIQKHQHEKYLGLFDYLINYFLDNNPRIEADQTIAYHSWLLKFIQGIPDCLNIHEVKIDGQGFIEGADCAIAIVLEQNNECLKHGVVPLYPTFSQMIVVSKGVLEGMPFDAVRYPSPNHMTGWWLTTELYDGDIKSLQTVHYYHVAFKRPDIMRFFALPFGFRFLSSQEGEVWFDEDVLA